MPKLAYDNGLILIETTLHDLGDTVSQTTANQPSDTNQPMPLQLFDTLSGQKRPFVPREVGKVGMYVCGMTVYDYCHIGHARVMVAFDVIVRWLAAIGYTVTYVRNITDIDDKIIDRAQQNGETIGELTTRFIAAMHEDADALGCLRPTLEPRATDYIDAMQALIGTLADKGFAYQGKDGDVYYAVDKFPDYGKLSKRKLSDLQAGARVATADDKRAPYDFVLWKAAKPDEPHWASTWGAGRPGWHIECSAMSGCCLGATFDIHGGGHDLQFPHHENEIAQSEGATGQTYANNWLHVGFVNVDGEKMSKSLNNFFTIREVLARFHPETLRLFILASHYRSPINFSDTALQEAHASLTRLYQALHNAEQLTTSTASLQASSSVNTFEAQFSRAMCDDFNTSEALGVLFSLAREVNKACQNHDSAQAAALANQLKTLAAPLNILQRAPQEFLQAAIGEAGLSEADIVQAIAERQAAKAAKDYARADQIRQDLHAQGIELADGKDGTTWRRI